MLLMETLYTKMKNSYAVRFVRIDVNIGKSLFPHPVLSKLFKNHQDRIFYRLGFNVKFWWLFFRPLVEPFFLFYTTSISPDTYSLCLFEEKSFVERWAFLDGEKITV